MEDKHDPRAEIPGTTTRFRFGQDNRYAYFGPIIALIVVVIIGIYGFSYWSGNRGGSSIEQPAVKPDASPQAPNTSK